MSGVVMIGPWGSQSGNELDITEAPLRLESITVRHGDVLDAISFSYRDSQNRPQTGGQWGGNGGNVTTIQLGETEFVTEVHGTYGLSYYGHHVIAKLTIVTNVKSYGPFGSADLEGSPERFSVPVFFLTKSVPVKKSSIVGFFAHTGTVYVSAIGVYVRPL